MVYTAFEGAMTIYNYANTIWAACHTITIEENY